MPLIFKRIKYCYLLDGQMSEDSPQIARNENARKARPTMELYCPRMLRTSTVGKKFDTKEKNSNIQHPPKSVNIGRGRFLQV